MRERERMRKCIVTRVFSSAHGLKWGLIKNISSVIL